MHSQSIAVALSVFSNRRRRTGMTLIEVLIAVLILSIVVGTVGKATGMFAATVDASKERSDRSVARAALDARVGEVSRTAPQLGDLTVVGATSLSFRKRQAPSAAVCSYSSPTLQVRLTTAELANIRSGDSVAVRNSRGTPDPSDDTWDLGVIANAAQSGVCDGAPTVAAGIVSPPSNGTIIAGASVRVWSTRSFTIQAAPAAEVGLLAGSVLTETINGGSPTRAYGPFVTGPVFTYLDASGNTAGLVRATFAPIAQRQRQSVTLRPEHLEWPIGSAAINVATTAGDVPVVAGPSSSAPRCNTPGASNFGSLTDACAYPPPIAVANATPNPVTTGVPVNFDMSGSYDIGGNAVTQYGWVIGGSSYSQPTLSLTFAPGNVCWTAKVTNARNLTSTQQSGCVAVYAVPTATATGTPNPVTVGQAVTLSCAVDGKGRSIGSYQWSIDGSGSSGATVSTTPSTAGNHTYQCRGQSDLGAWSAWSYPATYYAFPPPVAAPVVTPSAVTTGQTVNLGMGSTTGNGRALQTCQWGIFGAYYYTCSGGSVTAPGPMSTCWQLQVSNDLGAWSNLATGCITVYAVPTATATVNVGTQDVGQYVTLSAGSVDGKGRSIAAYSWSGSSSSSSVAVYCPAPGSYSAALQVENDLGAWSTPSSVSWTCISTPVARGSGPGAVVERNNATFDASGSSTPGGSITTYNWYIEGVQYYGNYPTVTRTLNNVGTVNWQVQVLNQWGTWSSWSTGSVSVQINPCPYNGSISVYSSSCVPPDPPCSYSGAPAGLTQSDSRCNPWQNAIRFTGGTSVSGSLGDYGDFNCVPGSVGGDHTLNFTCSGSLYSGSQSQNYTITLTPGSWSQTYCSNPLRCSINGSGGYINATGVSIAYSGPFSLAPTQTTVSQSYSAKYRFITSGITVTATTYKDWSKP